MKNIYEHFGCKNREELFEKIRNNEESVKPLIEYITYSKMFENKEILDSPERFVSLFYKYNQPKDNEIYAVYVNTQGKPVHLSIIKAGDKKNVKQSIYEGLVAGASCVAFLSSELLPNRHIEEIKKMASLVQLKPVDTFKYFESSNSYFSEEKNDFVSLTEESKTQKVKKDKTMNYIQLEHGEEFFTYMVNEVTQGMNVINEENAIYDHLKKGYGNFEREIFGIIMVDQNDKVNKIKNIFSGGRDACIVDRRIITKELLKEEPKSVYFFHNHPSGSMTPSINDMQLNDILKQLATNLDIEFKDNLVVSKQGVYSIEHKKKYESSKKIKFSFSKDEQEVEF